MSGIFGSNPDDPHPRHSSLRAGARRHVCADRARADAAIRHRPHHESVLRRISRRRRLRRAISLHWHGDQPDPWPAVDRAGFVRRQLAVVPHRADASGQARQEPGHAGSRQQRERFTQSVGAAISAGARRVDRFG